MPRPEPETRTYTITARPDVLARIERMLTLMKLMGSWGSSREISTYFDGDGADRLDVSGASLASYQPGAAQAVGHGGTVHVHDGGFSVYSPHYEDEPRRRYRDNGEKFNDDDER